jgi:hypothetical protein
VTLLPSLSRVLTARLVGPSLFLALLVLPVRVPAATAYHPLKPAAPAATPLPAGKRIPAGWSAFPVGTTPALLRLPATLPSGPATLRLTTALDDREPRHVEVRLPGPDARPLGTLDLRYAHAIETFQLVLSADVVAAARVHGLELRLRTPGAPLWFFAPAASAASFAPALPPEFHPHLLTVSGTPDRLAEFKTRFGSLASLQTFGWMQGCVFDGLHDLGAGPDGARFLAAREAQWRVFVPTRDRLIYENPRSEPADNRVYGIEGGLPYADLARREPASLHVDRFVAFARQRLRADGAIQDGDTLSAEGSYTIGYPLAVIAAARRDRALAEIALNQLRLRAARLWHDGAVWLRRTDQDQRTFRAWARGVAWHALGVARSIAPLRAAGVATTELETELRRLAAWVLPLQRADGLWACFIEEREQQLPDTSGSAGIAAALALGHRSGTLDDDAATAARRALAGLLPHLTPDGLLAGAAQSNRGGEALQRSDYRVLSQMGMGLLAQLLAALDSAPAAP